MIAVSAGSHCEGCLPGSSVWISNAACVDYGVFTSMQVLHVLPLRGIGLVSLCFFCGVYLLMKPASVAGSAQEEEGDCQEAAGQDPGSGAGRLQKGRGPA